jgi:hypothetical protein
LGGVNDFVMTALETKKVDDEVKNIKYYVTSFTNVNLAIILEILNKKMPNRRQFHQFFTRVFFVLNFGAKNYKAEMYLEKAAQFAFVRKRHMCKMLMKLTLET